MKEQFFSATQLYDKLKHIRVNNPLCEYTLARCEVLYPKIALIQQLKKKHNALILAHSYVHPDIIYGVADFVGDSFELAKRAKEAKEQMIVFAAVRFMAETAKILNPNKLVLDPNPNGKCSLADSINKEQLIEIKKKHPDHTFVCYINTTAAIKALCDVCVTSSNAFHIIASHPSKKIFFLPDQLMGKNIQNELAAKGIVKEIALFKGECHVHEEYSPEHIDVIRSAHPEALVLAHPECKESVLRLADFVGSTSQMMQFVKERSFKGKFLLLTECGISARLQVETPSCDIVGACMLCKYMKTNSLDQIIQTIENPSPSQTIEIEKSVILKAKQSLDAMFHYAKK